MSIVKSMKILSNSTWKLLSYQKQLFYRTCVLSSLLLFIVFHCGTIPKHCYYICWTNSTKYNKEHHCGFWVLSILYWLWKLKWLPDLYLYILFERNYMNNLSQHWMLLEAIMPSQKLKIKSSIVDANNHLNGVFLLQLQDLRVD